MASTSSIQFDPRTLLLAASTLAAATKCRDEQSIPEDNHCGHTSDIDTDSTASGETICDHSSAQSGTDIAVLDSVDDTINVTAWQSVGQGLAGIFKDELDMPEITAWQDVGRGFAGIFKDELDMPEVTAWQAVGRGVAGIFKDELAMPEVTAWQVVGRGFAGIFKDELDMP